ncbi:MAG: hypothetical protein HGA22_07010 [Clostridiales bacterium]|nr:hypothetical protein [Clostridiales bacterium]
MDRKELKIYRKNALKVLLDYTAALILFAIFLYAVFAYAGDKFMNYLPYYSVLMFVFAFIILFFDMKSVGKVEKNPHYNLNPYPLKGLVYGVFGFLPYVVIEIISVFLRFQDQFAARIEHLVVNTLLGPMYFIIGLTGESTAGYIAASLEIPLVSMIGYLAGYFGKSDSQLLRRADGEGGTAGLPITKSPWHPTNKPVPVAEPVKRKKKKIE